MWRRLRQIGLHHRPFPQQLTVGSAIGWAENPQSWSWDQKPSLSFIASEHLVLGRVQSKCWFNHKGFAKLTPRRRT